MYPVTETYKTDIENQVRNPSHINIVFGLIDPQAPNASTLTDDGHISYSNVGSMDLGLSVASTYGTLEHNRWILNGQMPVAVVTAPIFQGYVGDLISDIDGNWLENPTITITFADIYVQFGGLTFYFDPMGTDYPSEMEIKTYTDESLVMDETINPDDKMFRWEHNCPLCNKMEIIFKKSVLPYRRARMTSLIYGLVQVLTDADILDANSTMEIDMLSTKLPKADFDFTVLDTLQSYNPDNPTGIWKYLSQRQPVTAQIGYDLENGETEWMPWTNGYSTGEILVNSSGVATKVTIKSGGIINHLTQTYDKGKYYPAGRSLADLARDLMAFVGFTGAIDLDASLESIITYNPLPVDRVNNLLQLIANAGRCIIAVSRGGLITILNRENAVSDFHMSMDKQLNIPKTIKYPVLRTLNSYYNNIVKASVSSALATGVVVTNANSTVYTIGHVCATDQSYTVTGSVVVNNIQYYAYKTVATLTGTGTITINGYELKANKVSYSESFALAGEDLDLGNDLITSYDDMISYMTWVGNVMNKQTEYEADNRGYPELDPVDNILFDTNYSGDTPIPVTVIKNGISYNGTIRGKGKYLIGGDV